MTLIVTKVPILRFLTILCLFGKLLNSNKVNKKQKLDV